VVADRGGYSKSLFTQCAGNTLSKFQTFTKLKNQKSPTINNQQSKINNQKSTIKNHPPQHSPQIRKPSKTTNYEINTKLASYYIPLLPSQLPLLPTINQQKSKIKNQKSTIKNQPSTSIHLSKPIPSQGIPLSK
jgi:hypothetical protein